MQRIKEIIAVYSGIHTKHTNVRERRTKAVLHVKLGDTQSKNSAVGN
jgi:hypothetical protein